MEQSAPQEMAFATAYHMLCRTRQGCPLIKTDQVDHRQILRDLLVVAAGAFLIDVVAYAILPHDFHLLLIPQTERLKSMPRHEIVQRWLKLYPPKPRKVPIAVRREFPGELPPEVLEEEAEATYDRVFWDFLAGPKSVQMATIRQNLLSPDWQMKYLRETFTRELNRLDGHTGTRWERTVERNEVQSESELLAMIIHVDLAPVRAGLVESFDQYPFTSAYERLEAYRKHEASKGNRPA